MARKAAKNVPGTERYRDERRKSGGPRVHEREWHDHDDPRDLERVANSEGFDAVIEAESSGERTGMHRRGIAARASQSHEKRKRSTPPGKGPKKSNR
jgi:hypothetical protein